MRKLNGDHCRCSACGEYFNSTYAFDMHRIGAYAGKYPTRRCMSVEEMERHGMALSSTQWWISSKKADPSSPGMASAGDR